MPPDEEFHVMVLLKSDSSGLEQWWCPICNRKFEMVHPPNYRKTILSLGNEQVVHRIGKDGPNEFIPDKESIPIRTLEVWEEWFEDVGFEDWWEDNIEGEKE